MRNVLITGCGRGLGLEFARQCLLRGDQVFAGVRNVKSSSALLNLKDINPSLLNLIELDVSNLSSINNSYEIVRQKCNNLDLLINNAGVNSQSKDMGNPDSYNIIEKVEAEKILDMFRINTIAPLMMVQRYLDLLKKGSSSKIINLSSSRASINNKNDGGNYGYCASKAALNMLTRSLAFDLINYGIIVVAVDPGWVQTDMGGPQGKITTTQSVQGILTLLDGLDNAKAGSFLDWSGKLCQW